MKFQKSLENSFIEVKAQDLGNQLLRWKIRYTKEENNNVMSRYDHKIETSLEGIEHLSKEKKEKKERKMKEKNHYYLRDTKLLDF